jgi:hypothetical protein
MNDQERDAYVRATLLIQGYLFSEPRVASIVAQFERIEAIAAIIVDDELPFELESASVFRP